MRFSAMAATTFAESSNATVAERCPGTTRVGSWPSPVGLTLGILAVLFAQILVILYHYARLQWSATRRVQKDPRPYEFWEGIRSHLGNPGGVLMMVAYLCLTWMYDIMPCSYYHFDGGVRWWMVGLQICSQTPWKPLPSKISRRGAHNGYKTSRWWDFLTAM